MTTSQARITSRTCCPFMGPSNGVEKNSTPRTLARVNVTAGFVFGSCVSAWLAQRNRTIRQAKLNVWFMFASMCRAQKFTHGADRLVRQWRCASRHPRCSRLSLIRQEGLQLAQGQLRLQFLERSLLAERHQGKQFLVIGRAK